jgi:hypothetical protein
MQTIMILNVQIVMNLDKRVDIMNSKQLDIMCGPTETHVSDFSDWTVEAEQDTTFIGLDEDDETLEYLAKQILKATS